MSQPSQATTCPKCSTILVTGAHGFIATHIIDILLRTGFAVKGTARSQEKANYIQSVFDKRHPKSSFEAVIVPDVNLPGALDAPLKDCTGLIHVAHDLSMVQDFEVGYTTILKGMNNVLESALKTPTLKRFVYTSSLGAAGSPRSGHCEHLTPESWNRYALEEVRKAQPPYSSNYAMLIYQAAKVACEEAAQEFMKQHKPHFVYNAVLPNVNFGPILTPEKPQGSGGLTLGVYYGNELVISLISDEVFFPPQQMVDVRDTAWVHVLALTEEDAKNERLITASEAFSYNEMIDILSSFAPTGHKLPEKKEGLTQSGQTSDASRSLELLNRVGRDTWAPVAVALRENCLGETA